MVWGLLRVSTGRLLSHTGLCLVLLETWGRGICLSVCIVLASSTCGTLALVGSSIRRLSSISSSSSYSSSNNRISRGLSL